MLRSFFVTLLLAIVFFTAERYYHPTWLHPQWKAMLLFFLGVSFLLHRLMSTGFENNREKFVPMYMASLVARMILAILFVAYFLYRKVELKQVFISDFLVLYLFYTGFEIYSLSRNLRRDL